MYLLDPHAPKLRKSRYSPTAVHRRGGAIGIGKGSYYAENEACPQRETIEEGFNRIRLGRRRIVPGSDGSRTGSEYGVAGYGTGSDGPSW